MASSRMPDCLTVDAAAGRHVHGSGACLRRVLECWYDESPRWQGRTRCRGHSRCWSPFAVQLGAAGAAVYATGRTTRSQPSEMARPETIEETAELITAAGGRGFAVQVNHLVPDQVGTLVDRIDREQGRLDILVNDIWGAEQLVEWGKPMWESDLDKGLTSVGLSPHSPPTQKSTGGTASCCRVASWPRSTASPTSAAASPMYDATSWRAERTKRTST